MHDFRKGRTISIAQNCGVAVNRICQLLQTRVTPATSLSPTFRKVILHGHNVTSEKICVILQFQSAKKYDNQLKIKKSFGTIQLFEGSTFH